ncbi:substrate-binding periplasmic protein [Pseudoalteromonas pernae]|uniref:substrate-binding periplasmic protein n=1 Tax=Pseudoalteromonas pernae TaxID=3118054 RepID=UPI00324270A7
MYKRVVVVLFLVFSHSAFAQCDKPIRVGVGAHWPPYFVVTDNELSGVDLDITALILESIGRCAQFVRLPSPNRMRTEFEAGRIDMLMATSYTKERANLGNFSIAYREEILRLMVNEQVKVNLDLPLQQLMKQHKTMVLTQNTYFGKAVAEVMDDSKFARQIVYVSKVPLRFAMVASGHVDMTVIDELVASHLIKLSQHNGLRFSRAPIALEPVYFLINKKIASAEFLAKFNNAIESKHADIENKLASVRFSN